MNKNKLGYLGFLGLLGIVGVVTGFFILCFFFAFFAFFGLLKEKITDDERTDRNYERASKIAFNFDTVAAAAVLTFISITGTVTYWWLALAVPFLGIIVYGLSYLYYDRRGN